MVEVGVSFGTSVAVGTGVAVATGLTAMGVTAMSLAFDVVVDLAVAVSSGLGCRSFRRSHFGAESQVSHIGILTRVYLAG